MLDGLDVVLVHGTTQNAAGFDRLVDALHDRDHRAYAVQLPSSGDVAGRTTDATTSAVLEAFAAAVCEQCRGPLDGRAGPVVVAHSASGLLLPAVAAALGATCRVYLAAVAPDRAGGRSLLDELTADPADIVDPAWIGADPTADAVLACHFLFHDVIARGDLALLRRALGTVAPTRLDALYALVPGRVPGRGFELDAAGWSIPAGYVLPRDDRTLRPTWMTRVARERLGVEPVVVDGGHNAYVATPGPVADAILEAAGRAGVP